MKLLIIDGNSLLHRAYYALPDWRNRSGEATGGVYGFLSMMIKAIDALNPTHLIIVFDSNTGVNFRKELYVGYHANRDKDEKITKDIWEQVDKLKIVFEKLGVPVFQTPNVEADDTVGTLCRQITSLKPQASVVVITGDRDLMQLVNDQVNLYMPQKGVSDGQIVDRDKVKERLGVWPEEVIDYKALVGDASDGYPGVIGIGPTTAVKLIDLFGTYERLYAEITNPKSQEPNNNQITKAQIKKLIDGKAGGDLSKVLATIKTDVPVKLDIEKAIIPNRDSLVQIFKELGHRSLIRRMTGEDVELDDTQQKLFE